MYPVGAWGKGSSHGRTHALADNTGVVPDRVHPGDGASEAPVSTWPSHRSIWNGRIGKRNSRIPVDIGVLRDDCRRQTCTYMILMETLRTEARWFSSAGFSSVHQRAT